MNDFMNRTMALTTCYDSESRRTQQAIGLEELIRHMKREAELDALERSQEQTQFSHIFLCLPGIAAEQQTSRLRRRPIYTAATLSCALLALNTQREGSVAADESSSHIW